jgi:hypothetical protein
MGKLLAAAIIGRVSANLSPMAALLRGVRSLSGHIPIETVDVKAKGFEHSA